MIIISNLKCMKEQWKLIKTKMITSLSLQGSWVKNTNFMEGDFISPLNKNNGIGAANFKLLPWIF